MIKEFVDQFEKNKLKIRERLSEKHVDSYMSLVKIVIENITDEDEYDSIDPERIHKIDDGDYQGALLFLIGSKSYQPRVYWYVFVDYGSCSGCDTLQGIHGYSDEKPTEEQLDDYMTLALHIVQKLKKISNEDEEGV